VGGWLPSGVIGRYRGIFVFVEDKRLAHYISMNQTGVQKKNSRQLDIDLVIVYVLPNYIDHRVSAVAIDPVAKITAVVSCINSTEKKY